MVAAMTPDTEKITVRQVVSENTQQVVARGEITVPGPKPDVDQVISTEGTASIKQTDLLPDKAVVEGTVTLQMIYVAFEPDQSVHHMHGQIPFTTYVDLPGALPGMDIKANVKIEDIKVTRSPRDPRKFEVIAVLEVTAKVFEVQEVEVLTQVPDGMEAQYDTLTINEVVGREVKQLIVSDEFDNPPEKPEPEKILDVDATATVTNTRIVANKVIVDGELTLQITYVGAVPEQSVHSMHHTVPFTDFVEVAGARPDMDVAADAFVENCQVDIKGDPVFTADCVIKLDVRVTEPREVRVVTAVAGATVKTVELNIEQLIGEATSQVVVRETFETPQQKPCPVKIINVTIDDTEVAETKVINNKVITRGFVSVKIVYVSDKPDQAVHAMHQRLNFRTFVEIRGATKDMDVDVRPVVEYIDVEPQACDVHIEAVIKVQVWVTDTLRREVVVSLVSAVEEECPVGEIIDYTIKSGDTLFELAQRYSTTVARILELNPGINPQNLQVGQVIKIPCGAKG